jgi:hypothetical protein
MSEAVLDDAIEQIADGLTVDWSAIDRGAPNRAREWAKSLRVLNDIVKLHRDAAADYDQTTMGTAATHAVQRPEPDTWGKYRLTNKVGEGSYGSVYRASTTSRSRSCIAAWATRGCASASCRKGVRSPRSNITTSCVCLGSKRMPIALACAWSSCAARRSPTSCAGRAG